MREQILAERARNGEDAYGMLVEWEVSRQQLWYVLGACMRCGSLQHLAAQCGGESQRHMEALREQVRELQQAATASAAAPRQTVASAVTAAPFVPHQADDSTDGPCDMEA